MVDRKKFLESTGFILVINISIIWALWQAVLLSSPTVFPLRQALARWTVVAQSFAWIFLLCSGALSFPLIKSVFLSISPKGRRALAALAVGSLLAVWLIPPRTNRIYFDEHIYENIGQTIAVTGEAWMCNEGEAEYGNYKPFAKEYNKQPNGLPFYLSLFYDVFGISEWSAHLADNVALLIGVMAVFFAGYLLFSSEIAGLFAGLLYLLTPMNLIWSATVAVEPAAAAFSALAIAATALYVREPSASTATLWGSATGLSLFYRPESICIIAPALLIVLLYRRREIFEPRFFGGLAVLAICTVIELLHLYAVRNEGWGTTGERFSWNAFYENFLVNVPYLYYNERYPVFFTVLALIGSLSIAPWRALLPLWLWFGYSFGVFLFFYAGSFNYGADVRFSMISAAPLSLLGGFGASVVLTLLGKFGRIKESGFSLTPFVAGAIFLAWIPFLPLIRMIGMEAADARIDVDAMRDFAKELPNESVVLSHTPTAWLMLGRNSLQSSNAMYNKPHVDDDLFRRYTGGVFFHFGAWCNYDNPTQQQFCTKILQSYYLKTVDERRYGNKRYILYQMAKDPQPGYEPPNPAASASDIKLKQGTQ